MYFIWNKLNHLIQLEEIIPGCQKSIFSLILWQIIWFASYSDWFPIHEWQYELSINTEDGYLLGDRLIDGS